LSLSRFMVHDASKARRPPRWLVDRALACKSCPPAFLAITRVTMDELPRLVSSFEAALQAQMACCYALHHCRMHLTLWLLIV
jgi:hypothetical protein